MEFSGTAANGYYDKEFVVNFSYGNLKVKSK